MDSRAQISRSDFNAWLKTAERYWSYNDLFIYKNRAIDRHFKNWSAYGSDDFNALTPPQQVLLYVSELDGQVLNGGLTQFLFNYSSILTDARVAIVDFGWADLSNRFERAISPLVENPDLGLLLFKNQNKFQDAAQDKHQEAAWQAYNTFLEAMDVDWFDDWFYRDATTAAFHAHIKSYVTEHIDDLAVIQ